MSGETPLKGAVVGCHGIGKMHAQAMKEAGEVDLVAVCDLVEEYARDLAAEHEGVDVFTDFTEMLEKLKPDVVALGVPTSAHAKMAIQAAEAGVRGIVGEKPMAANLAEARTMIEAAERCGAQLIINHQRRTFPCVMKMREMIQSGAIGEVYLIRGSCPGDILTDGTHLIDSLRYLGGDEDVQWVFGNVFRLPVQEGKPLGKGVVDKGGYRYRHGCPIENGGFATWEFAGGLRAEMLTGELRFPGSKYQDYEALGTAGRLRRQGDQGGLSIQAAGTDGWQTVDLGAEAGSPVARNYDLLARNVRAGGGEHPLKAENGLRVLEILMAVYESARLRAKIELPLDQDRSPMEIMVEDGQM